MSKDSFPQTWTTEFSLLQGLGKRIIVKIEKAEKKVKNLLRVKQF